MIDENKINLHINNKDEAFNAMRAYHNSEIAHKGHAISVLQTILQATILVYGGLFGLMLKDGITVNVIQFSGILLLLFITFASWRIARSTHEKIRQDNIQYCLHYFEYRKERELLGLEKDLIDNNFISKSESINIKARESQNNETILKKCEKLSSNEEAGGFLTFFNDLSGLSIKKTKKDAGHMFTQDILLNLVRIIFIICLIGTVGIYLLSFKVL